MFPLNKAVTLYKRPDNITRITDTTMLTASDAINWPIDIAPSSAKPGTIRAAVNGIKLAQIGQVPPCSTPPNKTPKYEAKITKL